MSLDRITIVSIITLAALLSLSCQKKMTETTQSVNSEAKVTSIFGEKADFQSSLVKLNTANFKNFDVSVQAFHTDAHKQFLDDPMKFIPLPDQSIAEGKTAVVGSRVCVLYPQATIKSTADLAALPKGIPIPFGTIIPIKGNKIEDPDNAERYGMFQYQDNWNWFYHTTFNGQEGLVFGADLYGLNDTNEANRISARLYQTSGKYDEFYPIVGYHPLPAQIVAGLEKEKLAIQTVNANEYSLSGYRSELMPDDMISLYSNHLPKYLETNDWRRKIPLFVTTDLVAHAQHLMFDRTLQYLEEAFFMPRLKELVAQFIDDLKTREPNSDSYRESMDKAIQYFQVAQALLDLSPDRVKNLDENYGADPFIYKDKNKDEVLSAYPDAVKDEISKIYKAEDFTESSVFAFADGTKSKEDYSQYKPRGHYTKNGSLSAYFRAMMWFGRIHFLIAESGPEPLADDKGQSSGASALTLSMEPIALLVTDVVKNDDKLYQKWSDLFDPITALIGLSDDLSFNDVMPLWKEEHVSQKDFGEWAGKKENLVAFMEKAHQKLQPPAISSSSVFWGPSEGSGKMEKSGDVGSKDRNPPMGWRLFGQRFTYDSAIHELVSPPRLLSRDMVRGLDIMKAFGSKTAEELLQSSDYPEMTGLKQQLDALEGEFSSYNAKFWQQTYYNGVLFQVKTQAQFEPGAGFYFTEGTGWGKKAMLSSHGTWSELRHDTLLYAKQSAAERAGDGDFEPTFRTEEIPEPIHYLEPNVPFWQGSALAVQNLLKTLDSYGLLDEEIAKNFGSLQEIYVKAAGIAELEAQNKPVPSDQVKWISKIPSELVYLVLIHIVGGDITDEDQLRMAIIADVYTNLEQGQVLETGVGIPYRIYVPLNDSQGGKRIAVGYTFSYYEFAQSMNSRMTDETWKGIVYPPKKADIAPVADMGKYQPFWIKGTPLSAEPNKTKE